MNFSFFECRHGNCPQTDFLWDDCAEVLHSYSLLQSCWRATFGKYRKLVRNHTAAKLPKNVSMRIQALGCASWVSVVCEGETGIAFRLIFIQLKLLIKIFRSRYATYNIKCYTDNMCLLFS